MPVLIITIEEDQATLDVLDWLQFYGKKVIRINYSSLVTAALTIGSNNSIALEVEGKIIDLHNISGFWYRRGTISIYEFPKELSNNNKETRTIFNHLQAEEKVLVDYINAFLGSRKNNLADQVTSNPNKLIVLQKAQTSGLKIPETIITSSKITLHRFLQKNKRIISKSMAEGIAATYDDGLVRTYTEEIDSAFIELLPNTFPPSLLQERIDKKYELRIFYLNGDFFSTAIISQYYNNEITDVRKHSLNNSNRNVPFELPNTIKHKLHSLMSDLGLKTASIDMALTPRMEYIFFEVNPIGQYSSNSHICNFNLEKKIAQFLANE